MEIEKKKKTNKNGIHKYQSNNIHKKTHAFLSAHLALPSCFSNMKETYFFIPLPGASVLLLPFASSASAVFGGK